MFRAAAWLIDTFYGWVHNYAIAIALGLHVRTIHRKLNALQLTGRHRSEYGNQHRDDRQRDGKFCGHRSKFGMPIAPKFTATAALLIPS